MTCRRYKSFCQMLTYKSHFVLLVVVCGLVRTFTSSKGQMKTALPFSTGRGGFLYGGMAENRQSVSGLSAREGCLSKRRMTCPVPMAR